ncbi:hypothetical protein C0992_011920 [Termitomyces sp. T32_za158]|nr:hypothetical protein C0992_011920 [Termitomyces sp. T32_za158]
MMVFQSHAKRTLSQDSDFPQTVSWSSETMKTRQSYSQSVSSDIIRFDNLEIVAPITSSIVAALDPTTLEVAFDHSCLEGLDEQLLRFPTDAYAAICWAEAVEEPRDLTRDLFLGGPPAPGGECSGEPFDSLSDESDSGTDECRTFNSGLSPLVRTYNLAVIPRVSHPSHSSAKTHFLTSFGRNEKFIFEPRFAHFDPADSIGLFPMPQRKAKATGVAALRQYLPLRRKKPTII